VQVRCRLEDIGQQMGVRIAHIAGACGQRRGLCWPEPG
jgi:hypothetical protein